MIQPGLMRRAAMLGLAAITAICADASVLFVQASATGGNNGTSWTDAYTSLQSALAAAQSGDEIWVASATYMPGAAGVATASFVLPGNVALYGGFAGTESAREQRDPVANITQLSGDIDGTAVNSYHVLRASAATVNTLVDGFVIRDGLANGVGVDRTGGALLNAGGSLQIIGCTFLNNRAFPAPSASPAQAGGDGGAVHCTAGQIDFMDCRFEANLAGNGTNGAACLCAGGGAGGHGGAVFSLDAALSFTNCQFVSNAAGNAGNAAQNQNAGNGGSGGAIRAFGGSIAIEGCAFTDNHAGAAGRSGQDDTAQTMGGRGGAVSLASINSAAVISSSTFSSNSTRNGRIANGGAIDLSTMQAVEIADCTFSANTLGTGELVAGHGGAIYASAAPLTVLRSVFDGNAAGDGARPLIRSEAGCGGAINSARGALTLVGCTFSNNRGAIRSRAGILWAAWAAPFSLGTRRATAPQERRDRYRSARASFAAIEAARCRRRWEPAAAAVRFTYSVPAAWRSPTR